MRNARMPATRRGISSYRHTALLEFPALVVIDTLPCWVFQLDVCACYIVFTFCIMDTPVLVKPFHDLGTRYQRMTRVLVSYALLSIFTHYLVICQGNIHENGYAFSRKTYAITLKIAKKPTILHGSPTQHTSPHPFKP